MIKPLKTGKWTFGENVYKEFNSHIEKSIPSYLKTQKLISELSTFVASGDSFNAEEGSNDDLVMCLVLFGWLVDQQYFKELSNLNIREKLYQSKMDAIDDMTVPFGIIDDGLDDEYEVGSDGTRWEIVS